MNQSVKEWAEKVQAFLEENQELADDPTLGQSAAQRLLLDTTNLLVPLAHEVTRLTNLQWEAANKLRDAMNDPHCSAGKVHNREKEHSRLKAEQEELHYWQDELDVFRSKVHDVYMARVNGTSAEPTESMEIFKPPKDEPEVDVDLLQLLLLDAQSAYLHPDKHDRYRGQMVEQLQAELGWDDEQAGAYADKVIDKAAKLNQVKMPSFWQRLFR